MAGDLIDPKTEALCVAYETAFGPRARIEAALALVAHARFLASRLRQVEESVGNWHARLVAIRSALLTRGCVGPELNALGQVSEAMGQTLLPASPAEAWERDLVLLRCQEAEAERDEERARTRTVAAKQHREIETAKAALATEKAARAEAEEVLAKVGRTLGCSERARRAPGEVLKAAAISASAFDAADKQAATEKARADKAEAERDELARVRDGGGDHASIDGVCERLATCVEGPSPAGWAAEATAVGRSDLRKLLAAYAALQALVAKLVGAVKEERAAEEVRLEMDAACESGEPWDYGRADVALARSRAAVDTLRSLLALASDPAQAGERVRSEDRLAGAKLMDAAWKAALAKASWSRPIELDVSDPATVLDRAAKAGEP